jgi:hypothetical protein
MFSKNKERLGAGYTHAKFGGLSGILIVELGP